MVDSRWSRLRELFDRVKELPPGERHAALDAGLADLPDLRGEVEALLAAHDAAAGFLEERPSPATGMTIGPYQLLEPLGEGGFGVVYLAEQARPIRRRVALKLIRPGMDSKQVIARFEAERQALALMDHPGIAQVFDAGETEAGRPYFAMEYVPGVPITHFADAEQLPLAARLSLFLATCDAVQHAHQRGVIHRDLKPSNILVVKRDGQPTVKIIDFGIAKATGDTSLGGPTMTREGMVVGTTGYMSPEQLGAIRSPVDTRSDIYSLGILLYELLSGDLPCGRERLREAGWLDALQLVIADPPGPATRAAAGDTGEIADRRSTDARTLLRALRGELEWITLRALQKEPDRRYATAFELGADIRRYLAHEPVSAAAPGALYRLSKFGRRHRVAVVAAALVLVALLAGAVATMIGLERAVRAERVARREAASSRQVADFLVQLFHASSPGQPGDSLTVRALLDRGVRRIETQPPDDPYVRARLLAAISDSYLNLEQFDAGLRVTRAALAAAESARPRDDVEVARGLDRLANGLSMAGMPDSVPPLVERTLGLLRAHPGADPGLLASALYRKARYRLDAGALAEADSLLDLSLEAAQSATPPDPAALARSYGTRALLASWRYDFDRAAADYTRALDYSIRAEEPMRTAGLHGALASTFLGQGRPDSALVHARRGVEMARRLYAPTHRSLAEALGGLAEVLSGLRRYPEAIAAQEEAVRILRGRDERSDLLPYSLAVLGDIHGAAGHVDSAIACTAEAVDCFRARLGPRHIRVAETLANLARYEMQADHPAAADTMLHQAIALLDALDDRSILSPLARQDHANLCLDLGRLAEAESLFTQAAARLDSTRAAMRPYCGDNLVGRARLRARARRHAEAESLLAAGVRLRAEGLPATDPGLLDLWLCAAEVSWLAGNTPRALEQLGRAARCGGTDADLGRYPELRPLRGRPGYPLVSSP